MVIFFLANMPKVQLADYSNSTILVPDTNVTYSSAAPPPRGAKC